MGRKWFFFLGLALLGGWSLVACGNLMSDGGNLQPVTQVTPNPTTNQIPAASPNLPAPPKLTTARSAPAFDNTVWLNSTQPLTLESLKGKVTIIEFWTFGCYNCQNVQPALKQWYADYKPYGLEIVAFHAPEFDYEKKLENVQAAAIKRGLEFPIAIDNDFKTWNKYHVNAWPTMFLLDKENRIRYTHVGEGEYGQIEAAIVALLNEK